MARKEIKIFMDSKEVSNFLKVIDWSWLFTFLSERYSVSLSPHKELKELRDGAAIILCLWTTVSESLSRHPMSSRTVTESFLLGARPARNCLTSMSRSHKIAEFAFSTANLCMTGSCLLAAPFFVPFSLHILANRIDWYLWRCFHH